MVAACMLVTSGIADMAGRVVGDILNGSGGGIGRWIR